jgi:hypothetical protein
VADLVIDVGQTEEVRSFTGRRHNQIDARVRPIMVEPAGNA